MKKVKSILSSRTFWLAVLQGLAGVLTVVATQHPELGFVLMLKSLVDVYLRSTTTTPVQML
jgi:hypothetical protein